MWGEIDPPVRRQPSWPESDTERELPAEPVTRSRDRNKPADRDAVPRPPLQDLPVRRRAGSAASNTSLSSGSFHPPCSEPSCVNGVILAVAVSGSLVKSQQMGEEELTLEERREELLQQFRSRPLVFLERYHACLKPEHLPAFAHVSSDPRAQHYSKVIQTRAASCTNRTRVRNQRYAALRALQKEGQYFSEEQMRRREPLLYEQYIGQYLTDEEVLERSQEAMMEDAQANQGAPEGGGAATGGLAHLLLNSYEERLIQDRLQAEQEREDDAREEEEDDDDDIRVQQKEWEPTQEEKVLLREEFISQMHQRFLDGKDKDFNYSEVDENPDYDNLDIVNRDAEDKYFDDDDEEEEELDSDDNEDNMTQ